ncbi:MAG TPA: hypothetical protein VMT72_25450 [Pseudolabrys sp.]|nr:hypothetical protein [Pseudolabrys sp.]
MATDQQIRDAFGRAQHNPMSAPAASIFARDALLDTNRRLAFELTYPLDCPPPEYEIFYAALSSDNSTEEVLHFSDGLWPLARANFIAHISSHRPADTTILYALLESHVAIDAADTYARLKACRAAAGVPAPSWVSVNQGLDELLKTHTAALFAGYDTIQDAVEPLLECTEQILANCERPLVEALGSVLGSYRWRVASTQMDALDQIENACAAIEAQPPDHAALIEELSIAVLRWNSLSKPLLIWGAHQGPFQPDFETPVDRLRLLITNLAETEHYEIAIKIAEVTSEVFNAVPTSFEKLAEDTRLMATLSQYASMKNLQDTLEELEADAGPLIQSLENDGFVHASCEPVKRLWDVFSQAVNTTRATRWSEVPWQIMRDFALHLSNKPEAAAAVASLISGLVDYGERVSAAPTILKALRDNLNFMKSFMGVELTIESFEPIHNQTKDTFFSKLRKKFGSRIPRLNVTRRLKRQHIIALAGFALVVLAALAVYYVDFNQARSIVLRALVETQPQQPAPSLSAETKPPVGTGQRLALDGVRYCLFQQERLQMVKQEVQGTEDARAYNLLIVDYNSRCSDYFYQDDDLKLVRAEVGAKKELLAADARRIMSTWPNRTREGPPKK